MKWNKSSYRKKSNIVLFKSVCMFLLIAFIMLMSLGTRSKAYIVGYVGICCISLLYFFVRTKYIHNSIIGNKLVLTNYSIKIFRIHKLIITLYIVITSIMVTVCMYQLFTDRNMPIWIWYASVLPMMYSDSVYLSGITAFGGEKYASGEYVIDYSDIDEIKIICEKNTIHGTMVLCCVYCNNKEIGYDKLFIDEYHELRLKIHQNKR